MSVCIVCRCVEGEVALGAVEKMSSPRTINLKPCSEIIAHLFHFSLYDIRRPIIQWMKSPGPDLSPLLLYYTQVCAHSDGDYVCNEQQPIAIDRTAQGTGPCSNSHTVLKSPNASHMGVLLVWFFSNVSTWF